MHSSHSWAPIRVNLLFLVYSAQTALDCVKWKPLHYLKDSVFRWVVKNRCYADLVNLKAAMHMNELKIIIFNANVHELLRLRFDRPIRPSNDNKDFCLRLKPNCLKRCCYRSCFVLLDQSRPDCDVTNTVGNVPWISRQTVSGVWTWTWWWK